MKKLTNSILLASALFMNTGCVSDTLVLVLPKNDHTNKVLLADTVQTKTNNEINSTTEKVVSKFDTKMVELNQETETKFNNLIDKL